jgi:hypothetical protein
MSVPFACAAGSSQPRLSLWPICNAFLERGGSLFGCVFASGAGAAANTDFSRWCYVTIGNPGDGANAAELDVVDPSPGLGDGGEQSVPAFGPHCRAHLRRWNFGLHHGLRGSGIQGTATVTLQSPQKSTPFCDEKLSANRPSVCGQAFARGRPRVSGQPGSRASGVLFPGG